MNVYFVDFNGHTEYDVEKHSTKANKFVYWKEEDILLIGSHFFETHKGICSEVGSLAPTTKPNGAGQILSSSICYWDSLGYDLVTPKELRKDIVSAIGLEDVSSKLEI